MLTDCVKKIKLDSPVTDEELGLGIFDQIGTNEVEESNKSRRQVGIFVFTTWARGMRNAATPSPAIVDSIVTISQALCK
jgi:hypothetical protein